MMIQAVYPLRPLMWMILVVWQGDVSYLMFSHSLHSKALLECMLPQLLNCINISVQSIVKSSFNLQTFILGLLIDVCIGTSMAEPTLPPCPCGSIPGQSNQHTHDGWCAFVYAESYYCLHLFPLAVLHSICHLALGQLPAIPLVTFGLGSKHAIEEQEVGRCTKTLCHVVEKAYRREQYFRGVLASETSFNAV